MNTLLLKKFTLEILRGVKALGFEPEARRGALGAKQAQAIAELTGRTIGELALLGIESDASTETQRRHRELLRETMELMTAFDFRLPDGQAAGDHHRIVQR